MSLADPGAWTIGDPFEAAPLIRARERMAKYAVRSVDEIMREMAALDRQRTPDDIRSDRIVLNLEMYYDDSSIEVADSTIPPRFE